MATVIDALLVTLGLDPKPFQKGTADAKKELKGLGDEGRRQSIEETKRHKEREAQAKATVQGITKIKNEVIGMAAALVSASGIMAFVASITKSDAAVGRLSNNLGMNVKELTAWKGAAEKLGGTGADIEGAFRNINKIVQEYRLTGSSSAFAPLARAGVDLAKFLDSSTTIEQRAMMVADALKKLSPQDAQSFGGMAGFGEDAITVLMKGSKAINEQVEAQRRTNVVSKEDVEAANKRELAYSRLTDALKNVGRSITTTLTPAIEWLMDVLAGMPEAILAVGALSTVFATLTALKFGGLIGGIGGIGTALAGAAAAGGGLMLLMGKLGLLGAAGAAGYFGAKALGADKLGEWLGDKMADAFIPDPMAGGAATSSGSRSASVSASGGGVAVGAGSAAGSSGALFSRLEKSFGLPAGLLDAVWAQESSRGKNMRSKAGAQGHFQFMPKTASEYGLKNPDDLTESATAAARMYSNLLKQYGGNLNMALAGYNWGSGNLQRHGSQGYRPPETVGYINRINANMRRGASGGNTSTTDVKINQVTIHTPATDAKGIAIDMGDAIQQHSFASSANVGIQ